MTTPPDLAAFEALFSAYLAHLGDLDVAALLGACALRHVPPGEVVIRQGAHHDALLFIEQGRLIVTVHNDQEAPHAVAELGPGDVVGEVGLLAPGDATATVTAAGRGRILALDSAALDALWAAHPAAASSLVQGLCRVMARRIRAVEGDLDQLDTHSSGFLGELLHRLFGRAA